MADTVQGPRPETVKPAGPSLWNNPTFRAVLYQLLVIGGVLLVAVYLVNNTLTNLDQRQIRTGYGFLSREAGFDIGERLIEYSPADTYLRALIIGVLNTLRVGILGVIFASILGLLIGIGRLSNNWLVAKICSLYVETIRNIPPLLHLFFWYAVFINLLPVNSQALHILPGMYLSNSGLNYAVPVPHWIYPYMALAFVIGCIGASYYWRWAKKKRDETGQGVPEFLPMAGFIIGLPLVVWLIGGAPTEMDAPIWGRFNFSGGHHVSPEFVALLVGLIIYTAGFIAETVRSGILAVSHGQTEAARSLGLRQGLILRLVILPQALRVIIPPLTSQYLNLIKNSSLAVAIGYPDIVSVADTTLNQTGQAIEAISIVMIVYLTISLSIAAFMNWYNKRVALVER
jgi:general L-amino acid transport system permease protein